jgi:hypothetical protein
MQLEAIHDEMLVSWGLGASRFRFTEVVAA